MSPVLINWLLFSALVLLWGTSFLFTSLAVDSIPPLIIVFVRVLLGAVTLFLVVSYKGLRLPRELKAWGAFSLLGVLGNLLPFFLIAWGQQFVNSGIAGVIMAVMPLITILLAHYFIEGETINRFKLAGFATGISGVVLLLGPVFGGSRQEILGAAAVFFSAGCYASNTIVARRLPNYGPLVTGAGVLISSVLIALPFWLLSVTNTDIEQISTISIAALLWLGIGPTGLAALVYFLIIQRAGPTFLSNINYLIPAVAFFAGAFFLGEKISVQSLLALLIILSGIGISRLRA